MALVGPRDGAVQRILEALGLQHRRVSRLEIVISLDRVVTVTATVSGPLDDEEADALADNLPALAPEVAVVGTITPETRLSEAFHAVGVPRHIAERYVGCLVMQAHRAGVRTSRQAVLELPVRSLAPLRYDARRSPVAARWLQRLLTAAGLRRLPRPSDPPG